MRNPCALGAWLTCCTERLRVPVERILPNPPEHCFGSAAVGGFDSMAPSRALPVCPYKTLGRSPPGFPLMRAARLGLRRGSLTSVTNSIPGKSKVMSADLRVLKILKLPIARRGHCCKNICLQSNHCRFGVASFDARLEAEFGGLDAPPESAPNQTRE